MTKFNSFVELLKIFLKFQYILRAAPLFHNPDNMALHNVTKNISKVPMVAAAIFFLGLWRAPKKWSARGQCLPHALQARARFKTIAYDDMLLLDRICREWFQSRARFQTIVFLGIPSLREIVRLHFNTRISWWFSFESAWGSLLSFGYLCFFFGFQPVSCENFAGPNMEWKTLFENGST